jgi:hypothetical protein
VEAEKANQLAVAANSISAEANRRVLEANTIARSGLTLQPQTDIGMGRVGSAPAPMEDRSGLKIGVSSPLDDGTKDRRQRENASSGTAVLALSTIYARLALYAPPEPSIQGDGRAASQ